MATALLTSHMWQREDILQLLCRCMAEIETMLHYMLHWCLAEMVFIVNALIRSLFSSGMQ